MHVSKTLLENMTFKERWQYLTEGADPEKLRKFKRYHENNREVFQTMRQLAEEAWDKGVKRVSHWLLLNRVRWEFEVVAYDSASQFKISNDYFAFYARLLIAKAPKFAGFITIKEMKR